MGSNRTIVRVVGYTAGVLVVGGLAVMCWTQQKALNALREQQHTHEERLAELDRLREENQAARGLQDQQAEIERLRENTKDLLRLRAEVTQLRAQLQEIEILRAANARLLQAVQSAGVMPSNQIAQLTAARRMGSILGVTVRSPANGQPGVEVTGVDPSSPVATSGILAGDIIVALDGQRVLSTGELQAQMLTRGVGETVALDVLRTNTILRLQTQTRAFPQ
ncbi:MAG TPA: PDZ domain-containing protein [Verrucomicrobiae bacterium]